MRRASTLAVAAPALMGVLALAGSVSAQVAAPSAGKAEGLRYLSWPGRGDITAPARDQAQPAPAQLAPARRDLRRPNTVIPHGGFASSEPAAPRTLTPAPGGERRTLTPATAWLRPAPEPAPVAAPEPRLTSPAPAPRPHPVPDYLPDQGGHAQPAPAETVYPAPVSQGASDSADPMAPRRDAPIFRMQREAAAVPPPAQPPAADAGASHPRPVADVANTGERPPRQGARYYSVHRQNGREPDPLTMPQPTYVDALVVTMSDTPASQDLAQPDQGPTLIRDRNGNMRAAPAASDGDHQ